MHAYADAYAWTSVLLLHHYPPSVSLALSHSLSRSNSLSAAYPFTLCLTGIVHLVINIPDVQVGMRLPASAAAGVRECGYECACVCVCVCARACVGATEHYIYYQSGTLLQHHSLETPPPVIPSIRSPPRGPAHPLLPWRSVGAFAGPPLPPRTAGSTRRTAGASPSGCRHLRRC